MRRWFPLIIGPPVILMLSFALTLLDKVNMGWGRQMYVRASLLTAAGPFAGVEHGVGVEPWLYAFLYGTPMVAAMLAYSFRPSKINVAITVIGFALWLFLGYSLVRADI